MESRVLNNKVLAIYQDIGIVNLLVDDLNKSGVFAENISIVKYLDNQQVTEKIVYTFKGMPSKMETTGIHRDYAETEKKPVSMVTLFRDEGISEKQAEVYNKKFINGNVMLIINTNQTNIQGVTEILNKYNPYTIDTF